MTHPAPDVTARNRYRSRVARQIFRKAGLAPVGLSAVFAIIYTAALLLTLLKLLEPTP